MPDASEPVDSTEVLKAIRILVQVTLDAEEPELYERTLREILAACDQVLLVKPRRSREPD